MTVQPSPERRSPFNHRRARTLGMLACGSLIAAALALSLWPGDPHAALAPRDEGAGRLTSPRATAALGAADRDCLAEAVYFEARNEPRAGRVAVAHVVLNRAASARYAGSVCEVIRQGEHRGRGRCQFSWRCDGVADIPRDMTAWAEAKAVAAEVVDGATADPTHGALYYHANYVQPDWAPRLRKTTTIGKHIYYTR